MDVGRYLVEAHRREGRPIGELARLHGVHRSWLYKLLARYRDEGAAGFVARSRRPHRSPAAMPPEVAEEIVRLRAALLAEGLDAGALTIPSGTSRGTVAGCRRRARSCACSADAVWWCPSRASGHARRSSGSKPRCRTSSG